MLSNPYRTGAGIQNDWQINMTWKNLKTWELATGFSFFIMNLLYSKKILDIWGNSFKKLLKYFSITISIVIAVIMAVLGITNFNLNSKVNYEIQEVPVSELTDYYDQRIWNWIQECNLSGDEINISRSYRYDPEKGNDITCYLIYMPHGYKGTKIKTNYYLGTGQKVLKLDFRNTSQIVDDKYYLCYLEVINNTEDFELRTFLDGEPIGYNDNGDTSYVALYRLL